MTRSIEQVYAAGRFYDTRAEWLAARAHSVGASDVGAILGVSPWVSPWDVWVRMTEGTAKQHDDDTLESFAMGHALEPVTLEKYARQTGRQTMAVDDCIHRHPTEGWAHASLDGLTVDCSPDHYEVGVVEAKMSREARAWGPDGHQFHEWGPGDEELMPAHIAVQAYWQLGVTQLPWCDVAVLMPYYALRVLRLHANLETQQRLIDKVGAWREAHIIKGDPPTPDNSDAMRRWLSRRWPGDPQKRTERARPEVLEMARELAEVRREKRRLDDRDKGLANRLGIALQDTYAAASDSGERIIYTIASEQRRIDSKRLREDHPDLAKQYMKTSTRSRGVLLYGFGEE